MGERSRYIRVVGKLVSSKFHWLPKTVSSLVAKNGFFEIPLVAKKGFFPDAVNRVKVGGVQGHLFICSYS